MLKVVERRQDHRGELWVSRRDMDDWIWAFVKLPMLLHQDKDIPPGSHFQRASNLDLVAMPLHMFRIPSVIFFPYITYFTGTWFDKVPSFVIPHLPLDRLDGRDWLNSLASFPLDLIGERFENLRLTWMEKDTPKAEGVEYQQVIRASSAAKAYLLGEIRHVYDESKTPFSSLKRDTPSRHCFGSRTTEFSITKGYLNWYIERFNAFYSELLKIGKQKSPDERIKCFIASLTIGRLAVDALTILSIDVPSVRKWQFFGFLDALASLINHLTTGNTNPQADKSKVMEILDQQFFQDHLLPVLEQIPIEPIREEITTHIKGIYDAIDSMKVIVRNKGVSRTLIGPELLWAYRNARHGYALNKKDQEALLWHSGSIPDDLPDLTIALWHYLLLRFPFI